jgi:hypothetical protein
MIEKFVLYYLHKFSLKYCAYNICETCPLGDKADICFIIKLERMMKDNKNKKKIGEK